MARLTANDAWLDDRGRAAAIESIDSEFEGPGETVDKKTLGRLLNLTGYQIEQAVARGAPVLQKGNQRTPWQFQAGAFMCWYLKDRCGLLDDSTAASEYHTAKTRKMRADCERVEYINAAAKAVTLTVDEVVSIYRDEADLIRRELGKFPARALAKLAKLGPDERKNPTMIEHALEDCVQDALRAISGAEHADA
jgi:phage terminase Nu1 subunit (DNA packaging protein)